MSLEDVLSPKRLHLGCGRKILQGWINLDAYPGEGVDVVADLDQCAVKPLPFETDSIDEFVGNHLVEHIRNVLPMMEELHRIAKPGAKATFRVPYGSSDEAFEDPTHVRQCFLSTFGFFSQPFYWRADYGYRGDWEVKEISLVVSKNRYEGKEWKTIIDDVWRLRNVVGEMIVEMEAIKPIRPPRRELQKRNTVTFIYSDLLY